MIALLQTAMLAASLVGAEPQELVAVDRVDLIELNHYYDENGKPVFRQLIFYDWCETEHRFDVRAWRLVKKPDQVPTRRWDSKGSNEYLCLWEDSGVLRKVVAAKLQKTWTQYDPELVERANLPKCQRKNLATLTPAPLVR